MDIIESTPDLLVGKLPDLFQKSLEKYDGGAKNALVIGTKLFINSEEFKEELIMFLEPESFDKLFIALDKKIQT
jgi:chemotaxis protein CheY-P-specific phosphatase CheC